MEEAKRKRSGKPSREAKAAQQRRWYAKNRDYWNAYQRARHRTVAIAKASVVADCITPPWPVETV